MVPLNVSKRKLTEAERLPSYSHHPPELTRGAGEEEISWESDTNTHWVFIVLLKCATKKALISPVHDSVRVLLSLCFCVHHQ